MLDNVVQGNVVNIGSKFLPACLNGSESITKALQAMQTTLQQLPATSAATRSRKARSVPTIWLIRSGTRQRTAGASRSLALQEPAREYHRRLRWSGAAGAGAG